MINQLVIHGLPSEFPEPKTLSAWPNNLPVQPTAFIGRDKELSEIDELFSNQDERLVTIVGPGGMGKSRLAIATGEEQLYLWDSMNGREELRFPHGVYFVPLAQLNSPDHLLTAIAKAVNFQFYEGVSPKEQIFEFFRQKRLLLILDNFEHLLDGANLLVEILNEAPEIKCLATSRERLNIQIETTYTLHGMAYPDNGMIQESVYSTTQVQYSAVNLFLEGARRVQLDLEFTNEDLKNIALICKLLDGMPLGVELAAAWMVVLKSHEIAEGT
jgi:predicted ATPase